MKRRQVVVAGLTTVAAAGLGACGDSAVPANVDSSTLTAAARRLAGIRVLFAHQSVGVDVLHGVEALAQEVQASIRIVDFNVVPHDSSPGIFHLRVGENGKPETKVDAFVELLTRSERLLFDVAILKLCYVDLDVTDNSRAKSLFKYFANAHRELQLARPDVRLVPATMPLVAEVNSWKTPIRRLVGMGAYGDVENIVRNVYNAEVRTTFRGTSIFDIASAESMQGEPGRQSGFIHNGQFMQTLSPLNTRDGGHLNELGSRLAGAEFIRATASALTLP
jgi:hypothetical protein